ncbi:MAG: hypothetical protein ACJA1W_000740 [Akkermansiaceae bacterium]
MIIESEDLERLGYQHRSSNSRELPAGPQLLFSHGVSNGPEELTIFSEIEPVENGGYNLSVNYWIGGVEAKESTKQTVFVKVPGVGSVTLANGYIVTWATKPGRE